MLALFQMTTKIECSPTQVRVARVLITVVYSGPQVHVP
jgi:hypothetical protein